MAAAMLCSCVTYHVLVPSLLAPRCRWASLTPGMWNLTYFSREPYHSPSLHVNMESSGQDISDEENIIVPQAQSVGGLKGYQFEPRREHNDISSEDDISSENSNDESDNSRSEEPRLGVTNWCTCEMCDLPPCQGSENVCVVEKLKQRDLLFPVQMVCLF